MCNQKIIDEDVLGKLNLTFYFFVCLFVFCLIFDYLCSAFLRDMKRRTK